MESGPSSSASSAQDFLPMSAIPLFATCSTEYIENVSKVVSATNQAYQEFLRSEDGIGFNGQVEFIFFFCQDSCRS